jgi:hypothetical protein
MPCPQMLFSNQQLLKILVIELPKESGSFLNFSVISLAPYSIVHLQKINQMISRNSRSKNHNHNLNPIMLSNKHHNKGVRNRMMVQNQTANLLLKIKLQLPQIKQNRNQQKVLKVKLIQLGRELLQ